MEQKYLKIGGIVLVVAIVGGIIWMNVLTRQARKNKIAQPMGKKPTFEPEEILEEEEI
jgi:hypothetical protein